MTISGALSDAWLLYRTLFRRSIVVAVVVYVFIVAVREIAHRPGGHFALDALSFVLDVAGPLLVQGALIELVRDIHVGNRPPPVGELFNRTRPRLLALIGGSLLYAVLVAGGLFLFVVPGLYVLARLSMIVPVIVLERMPVGAALGRSSDIVRGHSWRVLALMLINLVLESGMPSVVPYAFGLSVDGTAWILVSGVISVLLAPYLAHLLSAIYYKLTDPERPLIDPSLRDGSLWDPTLSRPHDSAAAHN